MYVLTNQIELRFIYRYVRQNDLGIIIGNGKSITKLSLSIVLCKVYNTEKK